MHALILPLVLLAGFLSPSRGPRIRDARSFSAFQQPWCCADTDAVQKAQSLFTRTRPTEGVEAFANTMWSVLMKLRDHGTVLFTVHLLNDGRCRFSDNEEFGVPKQRQPTPEDAKTRPAPLVGR